MMTNLIIFRCPQMDLAGKQDQLEGKLQQRYGYQKDQAKKEIDDWTSRQNW